MITRGEKKFNCCESVLIRINAAFDLPGFGPEIMRAASNMGGGVGGWGSICGAVSGVCISLGLLYGTEGGEIMEKFKEKRDYLRSFTQEFMKAFEDYWGTIKCIELLGVDFRTPEGKKRYEEMKMKGETRCNEYVEWASDKILDMIK